MMAYWSLDSDRARSPVVRYGFAIACVAVALGLAFPADYPGFRGVLPLLILAVVLAAWYAGTGPAVVAVVLATAAYDFFFTEPYYSFIISWRDLPNGLVLIVFAAVALWFVTVRRRIETQLRAARDRLEREIEQRTQQARLLDQAHDTIFMRDMNDVITY